MQLLKDTTFGRGDGTRVPEGAQLVVLVRCEPGNVLGLVDACRTHKRQLLDVGAAKRRIVEHLRIRGRHSCSRRTCTFSLVAEHTHPTHTTPHKKSSPPTDCGTRLLRLRRAAHLPSCLSPFLRTCFSVSSHRRSFALQCTLQYLMCDQRLLQRSPRAPAGCSRAPSFQRPFCSSSPSHACT